MTSEFQLSAYQQGLKYPRLKNTQNEPSQTCHALCSLQQHVLSKPKQPKLEEFGFVSCNHCSNNNRITWNGTLVAYCQYTECLKAIINKILMDITGSICQYQSPIWKGYNCEKEWGCQVRKHLCHGPQFYTSKTQSSLHQNIYLVRRVVVVTTDKHPETDLTLSSLLRHIYRTLQSSSFYLIPISFFQKLQFNP